MLHPLWLVAAVATALPLAQVRHPAIDGGPVLGQPRVEVVRTFEANGWIADAARSGRDAAHFGHAGIHLEVTVAFDRAGKSRAAQVKPWLDETSEAFLAQHYPGLLAWLMGAGRHQVRKHFANGELVGLDVGP